ncbi:MAG: thiol-disulfide oxidoreductase DCC family protein [Chitinophagaceae bacterium]|nr:thiol-disulfide oxidoreductase DCC family protein [Chitinophagaceae bacterium]
MVLFDGVCNLCQRSVQIILANDARGVFHFASLQSPLGLQVLQQHGLAAEHLKTFVLVENGQVYTRSTAALRVAGQLRAPWRWLRVLLLVPRPLRDGVYNLIARNRYRWFGKKEECWLPRPEWRSRFLDQAG